MLRQNSSHGYALIADIHKQFDVLLSPGTLYPLLYSLEKKGMISIEQDGRRKNYILTEKGLVQSDKVISIFSSQINQLLRFIGP
jgi:DNA-binding PadR family transcriptional regulator